MNYLAHLLLADDSDASRMGNLLGDFTHGSLEHLATQFPKEVIRGIEMHRAVDRFTDSHRYFKEAKALLLAPRRRFAGVVIDIFFDHFLCVHWERFANVSLAEFTQEIYRILERHPEWRVGRLAQVVPRMIQNDRLMSYRNKEGIEESLRLVSLRSPRLGEIAKSYEDFIAHYNEYEVLFLKFMPELVSFVKEWKSEH